MSHATSATQDGGVDGGNVRRSDLGRLRLRRWALGGATVASAGIVVVLTTSTARFSLLGVALLLVGALAVAVAVVIEVVRRELLGHVDYVNRVVEQGVVEVLPPGRVADRLLGRVYGPSPFNASLASALLGGEGLALDGSDSTISEYTEIDFTLTRVDDASYHLVMETQYSFRNRVPSRRLVVFATNDSTLRDRITLGCRFPLFELWFVREDEPSTLFEESVESMRDSVSVGIRFANREGDVLSVPARHPAHHMREVRVGDWGRYLTFFNVPDFDGAHLLRERYLDKLRIFEVDLEGLVEGHGDVGVIQGLTMRSTTLQLIDHQFCWWQAPYPCFVQRMGFDTSGFDLPGDRELRFMVKPFTISTEASAPTWRTSDKGTDVKLDVWMLAGHGMALMWRPD